MFIEHMSINLIAANFVLDFTKGTYYDLLSGESPHDFHSGLHRTTSSTSSNGGIHSDE
jgi:hypothetical protein